MVAVILPNRSCDNYTSKKVAEESHHTLTSMENTGYKRCLYYYYVQPVGYAEERRLFEGEKNSYIKPVGYGMERPLS